MRGLLLAMLVMMAPAAALATEPLSEQDIQTLPEDVVIGRTLDQLGEIMGLKPSYLPIGGPRSGFVLVTRPRATSATGICRADMLRPEFEPGLGVGEEIDRKALAVGFTADSLFAELKPGQACADLDPLARGFFVADTAYMARWTLDMLRKAIAGAPRKAFPIDCDRENWRQRTCAKVLAEVRLDRLWGVRRCDPVKAGVCLTLSIDDMILTLEGNAENGWTILRAKMIPAPVS